METGIVNHEKMKPFIINRNFMFIVGKSAKNSSEFIYTSSYNNISHELLNIINVTTKGVEFYGNT